MQWCCLTMLGSGGELQVPVSHAVWTVDTPATILYKQLFCFSLTVFDKVHEIINTYYKIGFVLDDFVYL